LVFRPRTFRSWHQLIVVAAITITAIASISPHIGIGQRRKLRASERLISEAATSGRQHVHGVRRERIGGSSKLRAAKRVGARAKASEATEPAIACRLRQACRVRRSSKPCRCSKAAITRGEATVASSKVCWCLRRLPRCCDVRYAWVESREVARTDARRFKTGRIAGALGGDAKSLSKAQCRGDGSKIERGGSDRAVLHSRIKRGGSCMRVIVRQCRLRFET
jgi:hypothetical protein